MRYIGSNIGFLGKLYQYRYGKKAAYWLPILLPIRLLVHLYYPAMKSIKAHLICNWWITEVFHKWPKVFTDDQIMLSFNQIKQQRKLLTIKKWNYSINSIILY